MGLFLEESFSIKPKYVEAEEFPLVDKLRFEKALGVYFSSHPLSAFRDLLKNGGPSDHSSAADAEGAAVNRRFARGHQNDSDKDRSAYGVSHIKR